MLGRYVSGSPTLAHLLERSRYVATLARSPKCAIVHVILAVTRIAIAGEFDFGDILRHVTGLTLQAAVRPRQRIVCLCVVIKAPPRPAIWIVAERTVRPQAALVMVVRVAGDAGQWRALEAQRAVAFLASHDRMASNEGKSSDVMIE